MQEDKPRARPGVCCPHWIDPKTGLPMDVSETCHRCAFWQPVQFFYPKAGAVDGLGEVKDVWDCAHAHAVRVAHDVGREIASVYEMIERLRDETCERQEVLIEIVGGEKADEARRRVALSKRKMIDASPANGKSR